MKIYFPDAASVRREKALEVLLALNELPLNGKPRWRPSVRSEQTTSWESILVRLVTETMAKSCKLFGGMFASFECSVFVELEKESCRARCRTHG